jgi:hypothetical protein
MEPISTMTLPGCYKATVNESETIIEAQPFYRARDRREASAPQAAGRGLPAVPHIDRS